MLLRVVIEPLLRFFDEKPDDSFGHASAVGATSPSRMAGAPRCLHSLGTATAPAKAGGASVLGPFCID